MNLKREMLMIIIPFLFTLLFIPCVKKIAEFIGAMDLPNERKVHKVPIARLGGLGIYGGFLIGYMIFGQQSIQMNAILIGSFIIIITGIIDDIRPVPAKYKLLGQLAGAAVIPFYGNIILQDVSAFGIYLDFGIFAPLVTMIFIVGIINCINLIDGLDGLAGGIASIYFLTIGIIALLLNHTVGLELTLTFVMLGSTLGFLYHNFYPAKIFMGDSGSMFLGYIIAVIALLGFKNVTLTSFAVPCLILAIPILDTLFAILRTKLTKNGTIKTIIAAIILLINLSLSFFMPSSLSLNVALKKSVIPRMINSIGTTNLIIFITSLITCVTSSPNKSLQFVGSGSGSGLGGSSLDE